MLDFAVVGGGPVGLLCAVALRRLGRSVTLLERNPKVRDETRSIGVHSAALACLDRVGLLDQLVARGVRIKRGVAVGSRGRLATVDFTRVSPRYGFALAIPQPQLEAVLEAAARDLGVRLIRGATVAGLSLCQDRVMVGYLRGDHHEGLAARHVLGCDGVHSSVRSMLGITECRHRLGGSYMMAEFPRTPGLGDDAWIYLADEGLVESFPLPSTRRWVVEAPGRREAVDLDELCELVRRRCGHTLDPRAGRQASVFGVSQALASRLRCGRVLLLGDAAHTLSPFGGQGMNLGWLDAFALAELVAKRWTAAGLGDAALTDWAKDRRHVAKLALRQAAWNTWIGRRSPLPRVRNALVRIALAEPFAVISRRRFAMTALGPCELRP